MSDPKLVKREDAASNAQNAFTREDSDRIDKMWANMVARSTEVRTTNAEFAHPKGLLRLIPTSTG